MHHQPPTAINFVLFNFFNICTYICVYIILNTFSLLYVFHFFITPCSSFMPARVVYFLFCMFFFYLFCECLLSTGTAAFTFTFTTFNFFHEFRLTSISFRQPLGNHTAAMLVLCLSRNFASFLLFYCYSYKYVCGVYRLRRGRHFAIDQRCKRNNIPKKNFELNRMENYIYNKIYFYFIKFSLFRSVV